MRRPPRRSQTVPALDCACAHARLEDRLLLSVSAAPRDASAVAVLVSPAAPAPAVAPDADPSAVALDAAVATTPAMAYAPAMDPGGFTLDPAGGVPAGWIATGGPSDPSSGGIVRAAWLSGSAPGSYESGPGALVGKELGPRSGRNPNDPASGIPIGSLGTDPLHEEDTATGANPGLQRDRGPTMARPGLLFYTSDPTDDSGSDPAPAAQAEPASEPALKGLEMGATEVAPMAVIPQPASPSGLAILAPTAWGDEPPAAPAPAASPGPEAAPPAPTEATATPGPVAPEGAPSAADEAAEGAEAAPPDPLGVGLRLTAPLVDLGGWDEALGRLVAGADDLAEGLADLGTPNPMVPWAVAAGLSLAAAEAVRRAGRRRPRLAAVFVDGSASVVGPDDDAPDDRHRHAPGLSQSVRGIIARGLSRWTSWR